MEQYASIPYVDKPVSRIFLGTQTREMTMGHNCDNLLDEVLASGVQTLDTARAYTASEKVLGDWMKRRQNRNQLVILSKGGHPSVFGRKRITETDIRKDVERSLGYLQTDYIDIYLLHRDDPEKPVDEAVEILNQLHKEGKIGAFGASNWTYERIADANDYAKRHGLIPFTVSSPNFGLAEQKEDPWGGACVTISGKDGEQAREWYRNNQMPVIAYSSLGRGLFSGKIGTVTMETYGKLLDEPARKGYLCEENLERVRRCAQMALEKGCSIPQIALAWIFRQHMNVFAITAVSKGERIQENLNALNIELSEDECRYLNLEV